FVRPFRSQPQPIAGKENAKSASGQLKKEFFRGDCFKPLDPFEILSDFPARIIGSFIFQKSPFGTVEVDGPYYPIQRCYSDKRRDIFLVDFISKALADGS
ncbi:MAG: hypothetical protein ACYC2R_15810, partial [Burkholderiales bacterium]